MQSLGVQRDADDCPRAVRDGQRCRRVRKGAAHSTEEREVRVMAAVHEAEHDVVWDDLWIDATRAGASSKTPEREVPANIPALRG